MMKLEIKPLSINRAWQGRRFKTQEYKQYERDLFIILPATFQVPQDGELELFLEFGVSKNFDWDNGIKPFIDVLQSRYNFNDNRIMGAVVNKVRVKKGEEYIIFDIRSYES